MSGPVIEVDELSFEGLEGHEAARAARAFEEMLSRLLEERGLPEGARMRDLAEVELGDLPAGASDTPEGLGRELARALYRRVAQ